MKKIVSDFTSQIKLRASKVTDTLSERSMLEARVYETKKGGREGAGFVAPFDSKIPSKRSK